MQRNTGDSGPVDAPPQRHSDDNCGIANLFGTDALSRFIDETLTEQIQSVGAGGGEEVT